MKFIEKKNKIICKISLLFQKIKDNEQNRSGKDQVKAKLLGDKNKRSIL